MQQVCICNVLHRARNLLRIRESILAEILKWVGYITYEFRRIQKFSSSRFVKIQKRFAAWTNFYPCCTVWLLSRFLLQSNVWIQLCVYPGVTNNHITCVYPPQVTSLQITTLDWFAFWTFARELYIKEGRCKLLNMKTAYMFFITICL